MKVHIINYYDGHDDETFVCENKDIRNSKLKEIMLNMIEGYEPSKDIDDIKELMEHEDYYGAYGNIECLEDFYERLVWDEVEVLTKETI